MKRITLLLLILTNYCFGQYSKNVIIFYDPQTNRSETNLYKDTIISFDFNTQYNHLKEANIKADIEKAVLHHDFRIIAISGVSYLYPGLEGGYKTNKNGKKTFIALSPSYDLHLKKFGFKVIKGTSDAINLNEVPLQSVAYDYAKGYNTLLFIEMKKRKL